MDNITNLLNDLQNGMNAIFAEIKNRYLNNKPEINEVEENKFEDLKRRYEELRRWTFFDFELDNLCEVTYKLTWGEDNLVYIEIKEIDNSNSSHYLIEKVNKYQNIIIDAHPLYNYLKEYICSLENYKNFQNKVNDFIKEADSFGEEYHQDKDWFYDYMGF